MNIFQKLIKRTVSVLIKPVLSGYLRKERVYTYHDLRLHILPGVFHPAFFFSTKFLLEELEDEDLGGKTLLELGAGSGLISFVAASLGAIVTATDVNVTAVKGLHQNSKRNKLPITVLHSDLFEHIPAQTFDYIIINPPYYPKNPRTASDMAWYCGENYEYFSGLFLQLSAYAKASSIIMMVLSEDCDVARIKQIGHHAGWSFKLRVSKRIIWEKNEIYTIERIPV